MVGQITFEFGAIQRQFDGSGPDVVGDYVTQMISSLSDGPLEHAELVGWTEENAQDQARYIPAPGVFMAVAGGLAFTRRRRRS